MKADDAPVMFDAAVQMSSTAFHRTDVVQRSSGGSKHSVSGGSEEMS